MAIPTIDVAFIKQYGAEVHEAYQRRGAKLRGSVRSRTDIAGASTIFQVVGKGIAGTKARNGLVPTMNIAHSTVECFLADYYAGDWVDKLDELKTNIDERGVIANGGAYALGRKTDELIISALDSAGGGRAVTGTGNLADTAALTKEKVYRALEMLNDGDVPDDGLRYGVVGSQQWTNLLGITEFANSQYVGNGDLPYAGPPMEMKRWLGVVWMRHPALTKASAVRSCYVYHQTAIGHASQQEVMTDITWHGDRAAHFINNMMAQGCVLVDELGVVRIKATES